MGTENHYNEKEKKQDIITHEAQIKTKSESFRRNESLSIIHTEAPAASLEASDSDFCRERELSCKHVLRWDCWMELLKLKASHEKQVPQVSAEHLTVDLSSSAARVKYTIGAHSVLINSIPHCKVASFFSGIS